MSSPEQDCFDDDDDDEEDEEEDRADVDDLVLGGVRVRLLGERDLDDEADDDEEDEDEDDESPAEFSRHCCWCRRLLAASWMPAVGTLVVGDRCWI